MSTVLASPAVSTPAFKPTAEQEAVVDFVASGRGSLDVDALAGAAKSSTLRLAAPEIKGKALVLAFNVSIKKALEASMPEHFDVLTINGLGHRAWQRVLGSTRINLENNKLYRLIRQEMEDNGFSYKDNEEIKDLLQSCVNAARTHGLVPEYRYPALPKVFIPDTVEGWLHLSDLAELDLTLKQLETALPMIRSILKKSIDQAFTGLIDFADQIYMSCQPAGTMVARANRGAQGFTWTPIEFIQEGDSVVSYNRKTGKFSGLYSHASKVGKTAVRPYTGKLYSVSVADKSTQATDSHKWLTRFVPDLARKPVWFTYLMEKDGWFRVGVTKNIGRRPDGSSSFGLACRAALETADKAWVLGAYASEQEARIGEALTSISFGITEQMFRDTNGAALSTAMHDAIARNIYVLPCAQACLEHFGRKYEFPFWTKNATRGLQSAFVTETCNLLPGLMELAAFTGGEEAAWLPLSLESEDVTDLPVYSMDVEKTELYISDGILTHNCCFNGAFPKYETVFGDEIQDFSPLNHYMLRKVVSSRFIGVGDERQSIYAFRGADSDSIPKIRQMFQTQTLQLSTTFRCARKIVDNVHWHAPHMKAADWAPEGEISTWEEWDSFNIPAGAMVICRNNAPLIGLAFKLLSQGTPITIVGGEFSKQLLGFIRRLSSNNPEMSASLFFAQLDKWMQDEINEAEARRSPSRAERATDKAEALRALPGQTVGDLMKALGAIFACKDGIITLSSGHKSKGLEEGTILHLSPHLIPSRFAETEKAKLQEKNLKYVIDTRAKTRLIYANFDMMGD